MGVSPVLHYDDNHAVSGSVGGASTRWNVERSKTRAPKPAECTGSSRRDPTLYATPTGRWTVFQRRMDGTVNFYRGWDEYKYGFGSAAGEHWLGLDTLELLTLNKAYELRVDMEDFEGESAFALYTTFSIGSEEDGYKLNVGGFKDGNAKDGLGKHNGQMFSTYDRDQDDDRWKDCAKKHVGGFWYYSVMTSVPCANTNPNGVYLWGEKDTETGVSWWPWKRAYYSVKSISMKIRTLAV